jgi:ketosteroid isomerase-like protein
VVRGCESSDQHVQVHEGLAVFTHIVRTTVCTRAGQTVLQERETIVFRRADGDRWLAVHEHLFPFPTG